MKMKEMLGRREDNRETDVVLQEERRRQEEREEREEEKEDRKEGHPASFADTDDENPPDEGAGVGGGGGGEGGREENFEMKRESEKKSWERNAEKGDEGGGIGGGGVRKIGGLRHRCFLNCRKIHNHGGHFRLEKKEEEEEEKEEEEEESRRSGGGRLDQGKSEDKAGGGGTKTLRLSRRIGGGGGGGGGAKHRNPCDRDGDSAGDGGVSGGVRGRTHTSPPPSPPPTTTTTTITCHPLITRQPPPPPLLPPPSPPMHILAPTSMCHAMPHIHYFPAPPPLHPWSNPVPPPCLLPFPSYRYHEHSLALFPWPARVPCHAHSPCLCHIAPSSPSTHPANPCQPAPALSPIGNSAGQEQHSPPPAFKKDYITSLAFLTRVDGVARVMADRSLPLKDLTRSSSPALCLLHHSPTNATMGRLHHHHHHHSHDLQCLQESLCRGAGKGGEVTAGLRHYCRSLLVSVLCPHNPPHEVQLVGKSVKELEGSAYRDHRDSQVRYCWRVASSLCLILELLGWLPAAQ